MFEIWRDIDGYDGKYQVSNIGRIRSTYSGTKHRIVVLKPMIQKNGYLYVILWKDNKKKHKLIHRLVALSFIENPNNYTEVNHKDENKENNVVENLEWCTHKENINHGLCKQKISNALINNEIQSKTIYQFSKDGKFIAEWPSAEEVERQLGYCSRDIRLCCQNKNRYAYGFIWTENKDYDVKNHKNRKNNSSGVIGVCLHKRSGKWQSSITINKRKIYLGEFTNKEDAIKSRLQAELNYIGKSASQNYLFEQYEIY